MKKLFLIALIGAGAWLVTPTPAPCDGWVCVGPCGGPGQCGHGCVCVGASTGVGRCVSQ